MRHLFFAFLFTIGVACAAKPVVLQDLDGESRHPLSGIDGKPAVIVFITSDCPVANAYVPEIKRLYTDYSKLGVNFTLAHVDPDISEKDAETHAKEYKLNLPIVIDREHRLVRKTKAEVTPEAVIIDGDGKQVYRGRINNLYAGYGDRRRKATVHDVREVLDALLAGKPAPKSGKNEEALGCFIEPLN